MFKHSFAPIENRNARILILGSIPGDASLAAGQYYAHPRNRFWPLVAALTGNDPPSDYRQKTALLLSSGIALWDVAGQAFRPGSMDSQIREVRPNPVDLFIRSHLCLERVGFNGRKAEELYDQYFSRYPHLQYFSLPSTSPANASFTLEDLFRYWLALFT